MALAIKINLTNITPGSFKSIDESNNAPTKNAIYAITNNFPFNLTSGSSDFNDKRANNKPLMTTIKTKIIRKIIMKKL